MRKHAERRLLPYSPEQLYDLVAAIERYPEFLPWCAGARIRSRTGPEIVADLIIGFRIYRERFTSRVVLDPPKAIHVTYTEGPFKFLRNDWGFEPAPGGGCALDFYVEFEFKSRLLQSVADVFFNEVVRRMVGAFETRAKKLYGAGIPGIVPQMLPPQTA